LLFYFLPGMRDTELPDHRDRVVLSEPPPEAPEIHRTEPAEVR
jgi:hypothetical protein